MGMRPPFFPGGPGEQASHLISAGVLVTLIRSEICRHLTAAYGSRGTVGSQFAGWFTRKSCSLPWSARAGPRLGTYQQRMEPQVTPLLLAYAGMGPPPGMMMRPPPFGGPHHFGGPPPHFMGGPPGELRR
jgi:hypothetical protein